MRRALILFPLVLTACFNGYSSDAPPSANELRVRRGAFANEIVLTGELDAERGDLISVPPMPVWQSSIKWLAVDGAEVKAGERVVELDNTAITSQLDSRQQTLVQTEQELTQNEAEWAASIAQKRLDVDKKKVERDKAAIDGAVEQEVLAAREYSERQVALTRAKVEYAKARDLLTSTERANAADRANLLLKLEAARRTLKTQELALTAMVLRAPRDGVVVVKDHPWEGRRLQEGDPVFVSMPLAQLPELSSLRVVASLADVDDGKVTVGMPATVILDAYPGSRFRGHIVEIAAVAQESARASLRRAFRVAVKLDDLDVTRMRPGLSARVVVRRDNAPAALLAPRGGLDFNAANPRARLANGKLVDVTLGPCSAQECVVVSGLAEGDRLSTARLKGEPDA